MSDDKKKKNEATIKGWIDEKIDDAMKSVTDKIDVPDIETAKKEIQEKWEEDLKAYDKRIKKMEDDIKRGPGSGTHVDGYDKEEAKKFRYSRAAYAMLMAKRNGPKAWDRFAPYEKEVLFQTAKKAGVTEGDDPNNVKVMEESYGPAGGYLIPDVLADGYIEELIDQAMLIQSGAQVLNGLKGAPFRLNKKTAGMTAYMVGAGSEPTSSDLTLGQISMQPRTMGMLGKFSKNVEDMGNDSVEAMLRQDMAETGGRKVDQQCLFGTGGSDEVLGLTNLGGDINTIATSSGAITMAYLHDFIYDIWQDAALKDPGSWRWWINPRTLSVIHQFQNAVTGDYFFRPEVWNPVKDGILGYPVNVTNQIPRNLGSSSLNAAILFGNWKEMIIGFWRNMEIMLLDQASDSSGNNAALLNQEWLLMFTRFDMCVRHEQSFSICTDTTS